jgi:hypothetical protein
MRGGSTRGRESDERAVRSFATISDGARAMLIDAVNCVSGTGHEFAVVGGWSPVLLNSHAVPHPGTIDADLLFSRGAEQGGLREVVRALIDAGFHPSAKHAFQLLRVVSVAGEKMVFNVDLLHPSEAITGRPSSADLFVEHITLEIPWDAIRGERFAAKSIAAPHSGFILDDQRYVLETVHVEDVEGETSSAEVPVIDELALLVTKSKSVSLAKRPRDSFDIWLAIDQARDPEQLAKDTRRLEEARTEAYLSLGEIWRVLDDGSFDRRANDYMPDDRRLEPEQLMKERPFSRRVGDFLEGAEVPRPSDTA